MNINYFLIYHLAYFIYVVYPFILHKIIYIP